MAASNNSPQQSAMEVGKAFIQQYYTVLHSRPKYLHRFYTNNSSLTIGEQDGPPSTTVTGQADIHDLWMKLELEGASAAITSVDAQASHCQGVVVFVTGQLQRRGGPKRTFVQIFYLAVQDKGYYVLNDIFRYMPDAPDSAAPAEAVPEAAAQANGFVAVPQQTTDASSMQQTAQTDASSPDVQQGQTAPASHTEAAHSGGFDEPGPAPSAAASLPPPPPAQPQHQEAFEERQAPPAQPQQPPQQQQQPAEAAPPPPAAPAAEEAPPPQAEPEPEAAAPEEQQPAAAAAPAADEAEEEPAAGSAADEPPAPPPEPAVPLTYAQRLKLGAAQAAAPAPPKPKPAPAPRPAPEAAPKPAGGDGAAPLANGQPEPGSYPAYPYVSNDEALSQSIFVKDLPQDISAQRLAEEFARFGPLRNGVRGVNLKAQKDKATFAFIEFEKEDAARAAVASTDMTIDGMPVKIDEKKPLYMTRGRGRGGDYGRGGGRGSEFQGRGYMGGRGDRGGRGGPDFSGRGRGPSRGGYLGARGPPGGDRGGRGRGPPGRGGVPRVPSRDAVPDEAGPPAQEGAEPAVATVKA